MGRKGFRQRINMFKAPPERNTQNWKQVKEGSTASIKRARGRAVRKEKIGARPPTWDFGVLAEDFWSFPKGTEKPLKSVKIRNDIIQFTFLHRLL